MLSYRHSFHAGNFADVLKHLVLIEILQHLKLKVGAFEYIDTHAGAGLFDLRSEHATKLQEYQGGIARLEPADWPELSTYLGLVSQINQTQFDALRAGTGKDSSGQDSSGQALSVYPGSPLIAKHLLRSQDRGWLFELHPTDFSLLAENVRGRQIRSFQENGFKGLMRLLPPKSRRALVLIDPSYEQKSDYAQVVATLLAAERKFSGGIYAVWYPVVDRSSTEQFVSGIQASGLRNIQRFELAVTADTDVRGMTASGMLIVNPPWLLMDKMKTLLPRLVTTLGRDEGAHFKAEILVSE